jgi:hypothetical protein
MFALPVRFARVAKSSICLDEKSKKKIFIVIIVFLYSCIFDFKPEYFFQESSSVFFLADPAARVLQLALTVLFY